MRMPITLICGLFGSTLFVAIHEQNDIRENVVERKTYVLIFSTIFVWNSSDSKEIWARYY